MRSERPHAPRALATANTYARVRWWASSFAIAITGLVGGLLSLTAGEPIAVVIALFVIAIVAGTSRLQARDEFRRGWRYGYESAVRVLIERQAGRTSDVELRAAVDGDPTPEPWDEHQPVGASRRRR